MFKTVLLSALENLGSEFTKDDLASEYLKECLKTFDAEAELEDVEKEEEMGVATATKEIEIEFDDENYIIIEVTGFYKVYKEESDNEYPGSKEYVFDSSDTESIQNNSNLTDEEIHQFYS